MKSFLISTLLFLGQAKAATGEFVFLGEQLSNAITPENIIYRLNVKNCLSLRDTEDVKITKCDSYTPGYRCTFTLSRVKGIGPGYLVVTVPFYDIASNRYVEINMPNTTLDVDFRRV